MFKDISSGLGGVVDRLRFQWDGLMRQLGDPGVEMNQWQNRLQSVSEDHRSRMSAARMHAVSSAGGGKDKIGGAVAGQRASACSCGPGSRKPVIVRDARLSAMAKSLSGHRLEERMGGNDSPKTVTTDRMFPDGIPDGLENVSL